MEIVSNKPWNSVVPDLFYYFFFLLESSAVAAPGTFSRPEALAFLPVAKPQCEKSVQAYLGEEQEH